jgi:hypothetical protein
MYLQCFLIGLLGVLFHQIIKIRSLRKRTIAANKKWSFSEYVYNDWPSMVLAVLSIVIVLIIQSELMNRWPWLQEWLKALYIGVGYMGSSILQSFLSKSEKQLLTIIDKKTNIADRMSTGIDDPSTDPKEPPPGEKP